MEERHVEVIDGMEVLPSSLEELMWLEPKGYERAVPLREIRSKEGRRQFPAGRYTRRRTSRTPRDSPWL